MVAMIEGELDISNAAQMASAIRERLPNDARGLVLDFTDLQFIDSAGIRAVFQLRQDLANRSHEIKLVVPAGAPIARALEIVDVPGTIGTLETADAAVESIAAPADS
jgi:anti-anti-sigma factor